MLATLVGDQAIGDAGKKSEALEISTLISFRAGTQGQQIVATTAGNAIHVFVANGEF